MKFAVKGTKSSVIQSLFARAIAVAMTVPELETRLKGKVASKYQVPSASCLARDSKILGNERIRERCVHGDEIRCRILITNGSCYYFNEVYSIRCFTLSRVCFHDGITSFNAVFK